MIANVLSPFAPSAHRISRAGYGYATALTDDELRRAAPSAFADAAHDSRSLRYAHIPTSNVIAGMREAGFLPVKAVQSRCRDEDKRGHSKHAIRFRREDQLSAPEAREVIITNSHDGSSAFRLDAGIFRLVCSNGLIVGRNDTSHSVRHSGDAKTEVIDCAFKIVNQFDTVAEDIELMKSVQVSRPLAVAFAASALEVRFETDAKPITPDQVLRPRRVADAGGDMWSLFNVAQENIVRGGILGKSLNAQGRAVTRNTREVKGIDQNSVLNRALWRLAVEVSKLAA